MYLITYYFLIKFFLIPFNYHVFDLIIILFDLLKCHFIIKFHLFIFIFYVFNLKTKAIINHFYLLIYHILIFTNLFFIIIFILILYISYYYHYLSLIFS